MLNVIIIDQLPLFRLGIRYCLEKRYDAIESRDYTSLQEAEAHAVLQKPDLILLGIDSEAEKAPIVRKAKQIYYGSRVVVYDSDTRAETGIGYLKSGAHGYLSKKSDLSMVLTCIEQVLEGKFYIDPRHMESFVNELIGGTSLATDKLVVQRMELTKRQLQIATLLAQGVSTSKIAQKLNLRATTISTVKSIIYRKLKVNSVIELSRLVAPY